MLERELLPHGRQVDFTVLVPESWAPDFATPFNQRMIGTKVLITNDFGDWLLLSTDVSEASTVKNKLHVARLWR